MPDDDPLDQYIATGSHDAFAVLVRRHLDAVYSQCLRRLRDRALAEDVTQSVFIILAQRAARVPRGTALGGWLYVVTQNACLNARRSAARRRSHEEKAAQMRFDESSDVTMNRLSAACDPLWERTEAVLDDALAELPTQDRDALVLRYLEGRSIAELGSALAVSEATARQRISRALARLRKKLATRGISLSTIALAGLLGTYAITPAPASLAASVVAGSFVSLTSLTPHAAIVKGSMKTMAWTQYRSAAAAIFLALVGLSVATLFVLSFAERVDRNAAAVVAAAASEGDEEQTTHEGEPVAVHPPSELAGEWTLVDPSHRVHREDNADMRVGLVSFDEDGRVVMTVRRDQGGGIAFDQPMVLELAEVNTADEPRTITLITGNENLNAGGLPKETRGQKTRWAYHFDTGTRTLRLAIPDEGGAAPRDFDEAPGREVLHLKRTTTQPTTRP